VMCRPLRFPRSARSARSNGIVSGDYVRCKLKFENSLFPKTRTICRTGASFPSRPERRDSTWPTLRVCNGQRQRSTSVLEVESGRGRNTHAASN
jgi:hypothetical protein